MVSATWILKTSIGIFLDHVFLGLGSSKVSCYKGLCWAVGCCLTYMPKHLGVCGRLSKMILNELDFDSIKTEFDVKTWFYSKGKFDVIVSNFYLNAKATFYHF